MLASKFNNTIPPFTDKGTEGDCVALNSGTLMPDLTEMSAGALDIGTLNHQFKVTQVLVV